MLEPLDDYWAELTIRDYVCSNCWGFLMKWPIKGTHLWRVLCHRCDEQTKGYVTKYYAETRRSESIGEQRETRTMLQDLGIISHEQSDKSVAELLAELGF